MVPMVVGVILTVTEVVHITERMVAGDIKNSDGSGSYYGADGSWGYTNSDGSRSYHGADGSWGYKNSDGSGSYHGADGSWGYTNSDGSGSYHGADGNDHYEDSKHSISDCWTDDDSDDPSFTDVDDDENEDDEDDSGIAYRDYSYTGRNYYSRGSDFSFKGFLRKVCKILNIIKKVIIGVAITAVVGFIAYNIYEISKQIPVGVDSGSVSGQQYEAVVVQLVESGFKNITPKALGDLEIAEENQAGIIDHISIDGDTSFVANDEYPNDAQIFVYYHSVKLISPPLSASDAKNRNYADVLKVYQDAGFVSIKLEKIDDLIFGWLTKNGSVESVSIDGETKFSEEYTCRPDAEVVIKYHTFSE